MNNNKLQALHLLESKNLFPELIMLVIIRTFLAQNSTPTRQHHKNHITKCKSITSLSTTASSYVPTINVCISSTCDNHKEA